MTDTSLWRPDCAPQAANSIFPAPTRYLLQWQVGALGELQFRFAGFDSLLPPCPDRFSSGRRLGLTGLADHFVGWAWTSAGGPLVTCATLWSEPWGIVQEISGCVWLGGFEGKPANPKSSLGGTLPHTHTRVPSVGAPNRRSDPCDLRRTRNCLAVGSCAAGELILPFQDATHGLCGLCPGAKKSGGLTQGALACRLKPWIKTVATGVVVPPMMVFNLLEMLEHSSWGSPSRPKQTLAKRERGWGNT